MRLIDADAKELGQRININFGTVTRFIIKSIIKDAPTIDAVSVIRCKDCHHWKKDAAGCTEFVGRCGIANYMVGATGYCVYGERKDGG